MNSAKSVSFNEKFLAICDCGLDANSGKWEVIDQRDWDVPEFNLHALNELCTNTICEGKDCKKCIITRIKEAVFEDVY